jgi:DNA-binding PadR family transcriptional regulator
MHELTVLGELLDEPMHGYLLAQILTAHLGPFRQISWGALYPLMHRLQENGLIEACEPIADSRGHRRKAYAITAAGRARFHELMAEPAEYGPDSRELFTIKMTKFGYVDALTQLAILRRYRGYAAYLRAHYEEGLAALAVNPYISQTERPGLLRALAYRLQLVRAEIEWVEQEITRTEDAIAGVAPRSAPRG